MEIKNKKSIFWVKSFENHEDWFVVALDQYLAEKYFCDYEGYDLEDVSSEAICIVKFEDKEKIEKEAYFPSSDMLIKNDFEAISKNEPRIFWRAGRKFCEGNILQQIIIERNEKKQGVYIIETRDSELYKIGITKDINKRLSQLQTSNPYEFYLIDFYVTTKSRELEKLLHKKFQLKRYKREWFKLNQKELYEACNFAANFVGRPIMECSSEKETPEIINTKSTDLPF